MSNCVFTHGVGGRSLVPIRYSPRPASAVWQVPLH